MIGPRSPAEAVAWWTSARLTPITERARAKTSSKVVTIAARMPASGKPA